MPLSATYSQTVFTKRDKEDPDQASDANPDCHVISCFFTVVCFELHRRRKNNEKNLLLKRNFNFFAIPVFALVFWKICPKSVAYFSDVIGTMCGSNIFLQLRGLF